jgi:D-alanine--poly(phosphoribitol) ligase subunit 1
MHQPTSARPRSIHEAVAIQARGNPTAVALIHQRDRIDYATLDAAADTIAADLHAAGVRPGTIVPVILPRSSRLIAVLLGILKCGAAYAALDSRWPQRRIKQIIALAQATVSVADQADDVSESRRVVLDESLDLAASRGERPPPVPVTGSDPATIFFTSGSTGIPKGVSSPHRATTRLFHSGGFAEFGPGRTVLQAAPVSWDAFSLEVWGPLTGGGSCAIADTDYLLPDDLAAIVATAGVDTAWLTSSLFNLLVDEDTSQNTFAGLRQVFTGGERLSPGHVARFLTRYPRITLINGYGPVESCIFATTHRITEDDCRRPGGIPLGLPVSETTVHIMRGDEIVGVGEVGEICLSGTGLADGYLGDAASTATAFTEILVDAKPVRVYRTGDYGLLDQHSVLHFKGRADAQMKIAGHRIEPGEIENTARRIPEIRDAAVGLLQADDGSERLAMAYTASAGSTIPAVEVRRILAGQMPAHLVPHIVRRLEKLPTTSTGKVDRQALRDLL